MTSVGSFDAKRALALAGVTAGALAIGVWVGSRRRDRDSSFKNRCQQRCVRTGSIFCAAEKARTGVGVRPSQMSAQPQAPGAAGTALASVERSISSDLWPSSAVIRVLGAEAPEEPSNDAMVDFYERLFGDEETKDVEIVMSDGSIRAHACVLCASSEAIKGMLRHGGTQQKLSWHEHNVDVGQFFLRLLYTGTVTEEDWASTDEGDDVPLRLVLGSLGIALVYLVKRVLPAVTQALQHRLNGDTFDLICSAAIRLDATALRLHCLQYAHENSRNLLRRDALKEGTRVRAVRGINAEYAEVPEGTLGTLKNVSGLQSVPGDDEAEVCWDPTIDGRAFSNSFCAVHGHIELFLPSKTMRDRYDAEELSPEVMFELAALWGVSRAPAERRRRRFL